jgi:hypothetical protein
MSEHAHIPEAEKFDSPSSAGCPMLLIAGGVGSRDRGRRFIPARAFAYTYLFAFCVFFTMIVGATFWNCLHHATDSEWSVVSSTADGKHREPVPVSPGFLRASPALRQDSLEVVGAAGWG